MLGSQGTVRKGLHMDDDRGGAELQGETAGEGSLSRVREGLSKGVTGGTSPNPERRGKMVFEAGGQQGGGDEPRTFWMEILTKAGPRPFPAEGCSGQLDGHAGALLEPACTGHRGDNGGGQPPPPTVTSV